MTKEQRERELLLIARDRSLNLDLPSEDIDWIISELKASWAKNDEAEKALEFYAGNPKGLEKEWSEYHTSHVCDVWSGGHDLLDYHGDFYEHAWDRSIDALKKIRGEE